MDCLSQEPDGGRIVSRRTDRNATIYPNLSMEDRLRIALGYRDAIMGFSGATIDDIRRDPQDRRRFVCGKNQPKILYDKLMKTGTTNNLCRGNSGRPTLITPSFEDKAVKAIRDNRYITARGIA